MLTIREATRDDATWIAPRLRPADRREVETVTGCPNGFLGRAILGFRELSRECLVAERAPKEPCLIFGVSDTATTKSGSVWMLATPEICRLRLSVFKGAKRYLGRWLQVYRELTNVVDLRNLLHYRWLGALGAEFGPTTIIREAPFQHFTFKQETGLCAFPSPLSPSLQ